MGSKRAFEIQASEGHIGWEYRVKGEGYLQEACCWPSFVVMRLQVLGLGLGYRVRV